MDIKKVKKSWFVNGKKLNGYNICYAIGGIEFKNNFGIVYPSKLEKKHIKFILENNFYAPEIEPANVKR